MEAPENHWWVDPYIVTKRRRAPRGDKNVWGQEGLRTDKGAFTHNRQRTISPRRSSRYLTFHMQYNILGAQFTMKIHCKWPSNAEFLNQIGTCGEPNMKHEREHGTWPEPKHTSHLFSLTHVMRSNDEWLGLEPWANAGIGSVDPCTMVGNPSTTKVDNGHIGDLLDI